jgi:hypothetical protein
MLQVSLDDYVDEDGRQTPNGFVAFVLFRLAFPFNRLKLRASKDL